MKKKKISWLLLLVFALSGCNEQTLLNGLNQKQANEVVAVLQSYDIDATKQSSAKQGFSVTVDKKQFLNAVNLVNHYDLPSKPRVEIAQMFPEDSLVASPLAEKARLYSAIEQRLEQSLKTLKGVITASLHISYDFSDISKKKDQDIHITAIVRYEAGADDQLLIADIKRFLKNSFNEVEYDNISVIMTPAARFDYASPDLKLTQSMPLFALIVALGGIAALFLILIFKFKNVLFQKWFTKKENGIKPGD